MSEKEGEMGLAKLAWEQTRKEMCAKVTEERDRLRERVEELEEERRALIHHLQRLQPPGSPAPGGPSELAQWIVGEVIAFRDRLRERVKELEERVKEQDDWMRHSVADHVEAAAALTGGPRDHHENMANWGRELLRRGDRS